MCKALYDIKEEGYRQGFAEGYVNSYLEEYINVLIERGLIDAEDERIEQLWQCHNEGFDPAELAAKMFELPREEYVRLLSVYCDMILYTFIGESVRNNLVA